LLRKECTKEGNRDVLASDEVIHVEALKLHYYGLLVCYRSVKSITQENSTRNVILLFMI